MYISMAEAKQPNKIIFMMRRGPRAAKLEMQNCIIGTLMMLTRHAQTSHSFNMRICQLRKY